jgi:hypothetical protein
MTRFSDYGNLLAGQPKTLPEGEIPLAMSINETPDFEVGLCSLRLI